VKKKKWNTKKYNGKRRRTELEQKAVGGEQEILTLTNLSLI